MQDQNPAGEPSDPMTDVGRAQLLLEIEERNLRGSIRNVADAMRYYADQIEREANLTSEPEDAASHVIIAWANSVNNLHLNSLPTASARVIRARIALAEAEKASTPRSHD